MNPPRLALATAVAVAAATLLSGIAPTYSARADVGGAPGVSAAAPGPSRVATATPRRGVTAIGDLRVGPFGAPDVVLTLADVRDAWGPELRLKPGTCTASWGTGVRLLFTSFGDPVPCEDQFLQIATVTGPRWKVAIGRQSYRIGLPRTQLPPGATRIRGWMGGGYELATMPFPGTPGRTTTVMAHVNSKTDRVDRFVLFIGGVGE
jgi:hypothetical protein